jgi:glycosyltransferase involved in cell wall biosynthesis
MFLLVGRGVDNPSFRRWSAELGCRVVLVDFTSSPERYVAACDIYVQPSRSEGLAKSLMEAMSLARPSIVDRVGGSRELIDDGRSGLVIDTGDPRQFAAALTALADDKQRRLDMGNQARATVATRFAMERAVQSQIALYEDLMRPGLEESPNATA